MGKKKTQKDYEQNIKEFHNMLLDPDCENREKVKGQLKRRIDEWAKFLTITAQVPNNEQKPWTAKEIGLPIETMPLKSKSGFDQTGDYTLHITGEDIDFTGGLVVERKSIGDMHNTIHNNDNRDRLLREIKRFHEDPRMSTFVIFAECSYTDLMKYHPPTNKMKQPAWKRRERIKVKLASFVARNIPVYWCDDRKTAARFFKLCAEQWVKKNYALILGY